jgi:hypothetical protein
MAFTVIIHLTGTDPFLAEMDELPDPKASFIVCTNPRARDGKNLIFIEPECTMLPVRALRRRPFDNYRLHE